MATKAPNAVIHDQLGFRQVWEALAGTDTGNWIIVAGTPDIHISAGGNLDGGTLTIQGTDDPNESVIYTVHELDLTDAQTTTVPYVVQLLEAPNKVRAVISGGGGSCDVDVILNAKKVR